MNSVFKFALAIRSEQVVVMPKDARILYAAWQPSTLSLCLWALISHNAQQENRTIEILGTGQIVREAPRRHLGTVLLNNGEEVLHIFERLKKEEASLQ